MESRHTFVNENGEDEMTLPTRVNARWEVVSTTVVTEFDGVLHFEHVIRRPSEQLPWAKAALAQVNVNDDDKET